MIYEKIFFLFIFLISVLSLKAQTLLIYGYDSDSDGYTVYLGKLNASSYDRESIWNEYGTYGSSYNRLSIWNEYGPYGNDYSSVCPFNEYASDPPILLDNKGNFYGYFTANKYKTDRCEYKLIDIICKYYEQIREDVDEWYDLIFE